VDNLLALEQHHIPVEVLASECVVHRRTWYGFRLHSLLTIDTVHRKSPMPVLVDAWNVAPKGRHGQVENGRRIRNTPAVFTCASV
jgi:hypothetical protein